MARNLYLMIVMALTFVAASTHTAKADIIDLQLTGNSADYNLPLTADVRLESLSSTELKVSITNTATDAGKDNQLTYFGIQVPKDGTSALVIDAETDGDWDIELSSKLPGDGADEFNFLHVFIKARGDIGLDIGETLTVKFTTTEPSFDPLDLNTWEGTDKRNYIMAAKFQKVGADEEDSGVAAYSNVPEPASIALMIPGTLLLLSRRHKKQAA